MKILSLVAFVLFDLMAIQTQAQKKVDLKPTQFNVNILELGAAFEAKVGEKQSLFLSLGILPSAYAETNSNGNSYSYFALTPRFRAEFRGYYDRKRVKKSLNQNSGNFVGLTTGYVFDTIADNLGDGEVFAASNAFYVGPVWGIQRNYKNGFHFGLTLGYGVMTGQNTEATGVLINDVTIGFVLK